VLHRPERNNKQEVRKQTEQEVTVRARWYRVRALPLAGSEHGEEILVALTADAHLDS